MSTEDLAPLSADDLAAEGATALPRKEVISLLDLNADLNAALDIAAPVDLAVAANANVAAPIDAAVSANILSVGSESAALADQDAVILQGITGDAVANAPQDSVLEQGDDAAGTTAAPAADGSSTTGLPTDPASALDGDLLNVDVNAAIDADAAAPIAGAVAANANIAAPIDAAVSANIGSIDSQSTAIADQDVVISQNLDDVSAEATADQSSTITQ